MTTPEIKRGRPQSTTISTLRDAAFELFQSQGYEDTSVADIAQVAGVSRATFFNYFDAKSDVFWVEVDEALHDLPIELRKLDPTDDFFAGLSDALEHVLHTWDGGNVPWIFVQFDLIGQPSAVRESATIRIVRAQSILADAISKQLAIKHPDLRTRTISYTVISSIIAAAVTWAQSPPPRGTIMHYVERALSSLSRGIAELTDPSQ